MAEGEVLNTFQCGFESHMDYVKVKEMIEYLQQFEDYDVVAEPFSLNSPYEDSDIAAVERSLRHDKKYFVLEDQF